MEESYDPKLTNKIGEEAGITLSAFIDRWVESTYETLDETLDDSSDDSTCSEDSLVIVEAPVDFKNETE